MERNKYIKFHYDLRSLNIFFLFSYNASEIFSNRTKTICSQSIKPKHISPDCPPRCGYCLFWPNLWVVNPRYSRLNCFGLLKKNVDLAMLLFKLSTIGKWTLSFKKFYQYLLNTHADALTRTHTLTRTLRGDNLDLRCESHFPGVHFKSA